MTAEDESIDRSHKRGTHRVARRRDGRRCHVRIGGAGVRRASRVRSWPRPAQRPPSTSQPPRSSVSARSGTSRRLRRPTTRSTRSGSSTPGSPPAEPIWAKPGAVADVVTSEFGLSGSGGQAATGAALRGLRTAQERGYLTHWDRMVQGSQNEIARTRDSQQTSATRAGPGRGALLPPLPMSLPHGPRLMYEDKETKWRSLEF
jgi:hypothetical protein